MLKNTSGQHISFIGIATADGSAVTSGTPVVYLSLDGATQATSTNTATHLGNGVWILDLTQAETNADNLAAVMVLSTAINSFAQAYPYVLSDFKANVAGLSTFDAAADAVANVTLVATCTTNTDMRGTDSANTVAPDNAGITSNGTAIGSLNNFNPSSDTVLNVTTVGTCVLNSDMRGTDNANTVAPANGDITGIKAKTDSLTFTGNDVNANVQAGSSDATAANQVAIQNSIAALNNFDPSADTVAQVSDVALVAVCTTNSDMRGTDSANTIAPDNAGIAANGVAVASLNDFDPATQAIANVTNVATTAVCVSNTDMRGTDGANTVVPDNAGIAANGTVLAATTKTGVQYTATAQSGDTIQVTLS